MPSHPLKTAQDLAVHQPTDWVTERESLLLQLEQLSQTLAWQQAENETLKLSCELHKASSEAGKLEFERLIQELRSNSHLQERQALTNEQIEACNPDGMKALKLMFKRGVRFAEKYHGISKKT